MAKQSNIIIQQALLSANPSSPPAGYGIIFPKTDGFWYTKDAAGNVTQIEIIPSRTTVADANYTILSTDKDVAVTSITASRTLTLPAANSVNAGREIWVTDESGSVTSAITIIISRAGSDTIIGNGITGSTRVISTPYQCLKFISNGTSKWTVIGLISYSILLSANQDGTPASAGIVYLAVQPQQNVAANARYYIPTSGTITKAAVWISSTGGTSELGTVAIRLNNTTDTNIGASNSVNFSGSGKYSSTALSIAVVGDFTDYVAGKVIYPTWVTPPTNVRVSIVVWITQ